MRQYLDTQLSISGVSTQEKPTIVDSRSKSSSTTVVKNNGNQMSSHKCSSSTTSINLDLLQSEKDLIGKECVFNVYKDAGYLLQCSGALNGIESRNVCLMKEISDQVKKQFANALPKRIIGTVTESVIVGSSFKLGMKKDTKMIRLTISPNWTTLN